MTLQRAQRIVGFDIELERGTDRLWSATGTNPDYSYEVRVSGKRNEADCLADFVQEHYQWISGVVRSEQDFRCFFCGRLCALEIDHIKPRSQGRQDHRQNLRALGVEVGGCGCHARRHGLEVSG